MCKSLGWDSQGHHFEFDFMVLSMKCCDLVLRVQWLSSLDPIVWNFVDLTLSFVYDEIPCVLRGIVPGGLHVTKGSPLAKCISMRSIALALYYWLLRVMQHWL